MGNSIRVLRHQQTELHEDKHEAIFFPSVINTTMSLNGSCHDFSIFYPKINCAHSNIFLFSILFWNWQGEKSHRRLWNAESSFLPSPPIRFFQVVADTKKRKIFKQQLGRHPQTPTTRHKSSFEIERKGKTHQWQWLEGKWKSAGTTNIKKKKKKKIVCL